MSTVNEFNGTWAIRDHDLIPDTFANLLLERFWNYIPTRITRGRLLHDVPIQDINDYLNSWWQGPGSVSMIPSLIQELRATRITQPVSDAKLPEPPTIDDWVDPVFESKIPPSTSEED